MEIVPPSYTPVSIRTVTGPLPPAPSPFINSGSLYVTNGPIDGKKLRRGSSAYTRLSTAHPTGSRHPSFNANKCGGSFLPAAIHNICSTKSSFVTNSVIGCST